jgi:hypothetical protein
MMVFMTETCSVIRMFLINYSIPSISYLLKYKIVAIDRHHLFIYVQLWIFLNGCATGSFSRRSRLLGF